MHRTTSAFLPRIGRDGRGSSSTPNWSCPRFTPRPTATPMARPNGTKAAAIDFIRLFHLCQRDLSGYNRYALDSLGELPICPGRRACCSILFVAISSSANRWDDLGRPPEVAALAVFLASDGGELHHRAGLRGRRRHGDLTPAAPRSQKIKLFRRAADCLPDPPGNHQGAKIDVDHADQYPDLAVASMRPGRPSWSQRLPDFAVAERESAAGYRGPGPRGRAVDCRLVGLEPASAKPWGPTSAQGISNRVRLAT